MHDRNIKLSGTKTETEAQFPAFANLYNDVFGDRFTGEQGRTNMLKKQVRPMFETFAQEFDGAFKLPKQVDFDPIVREKLDRFMQDNPNLARCRACKRKFEARHHELCCSDKCKQSMRLATSGMTCTTCSKACNPTYFHYADKGLALHMRLLEMNLDTLHMSQYVLDFIEKTRRTKTKLYSAHSIANRVGCQSLCVALAVVRRQASRFNFPNRCI